MADGKIVIETELKTDKLKARLAGLNADIEKQMRKVEELARAYEEWNNIASSEKTDLGRVLPETQYNLENARIELDKGQATLQRMQADAANVANQLEQMGAGAEDAKEGLEDAGRSIDGFSKKLNAMIGKIAVFLLVAKALSTFRNYLRDALAANQEFQSALARTKGALLTAFQPIWETIVPWLIALLNVITRVAQAISWFFSLIFGSSVSNARDGAKAMYDEAKGIGAVGSAAKKATKELAAFDTIQKIGSDSSGGGGGAGGGGIGADFSGIKAEVSDLEVYMAGALLALGALLAFSGANIPLGLALMAAGAIGLASIIKENWNAMPDNLKSALIRTYFALAGFTLVLGAILALSGANIPLGIGLMIAGGIALLGGAVALNWNKIQSFVQKHLFAIQAIVSVALLALGAIIALSGGNLILGIGLLVAGVAGLANAVSLNWNKLPSEVQNKIQLITMIVGSALLALGAILVISGAAIPLGLGLLAAGGISLAASIAPSWDWLVKKCKEVWFSIKLWWNTSVAPVFTIDFWLGKFKSIGDALKQRIKDGVNGAITLLNSFIDKINDKMNLSWGGVPWLGIKGGSWQIMTLKHIPLLAEGAVIPPNREFLAMLGDQTSGTNIETPLSTMVQAFRMALNDYAGTEAVMVVDGEAFGRLAYKLGGAESRRIGVSLTEG